MDNKAFRVLISDNVPHNLAAHEYEGEVLEVVKNGLYYTPTKAQLAISRERGKRNCGFFSIDPQYATRVDETFEPESGMVFETAEGKTGLFVATSKGLHILFANGTHDAFSGGMLTGKGLTHITKIYKGMNELGYFGLVEFQKDALNENYLVWEYKAPEKPISVELNDSYTATVVGDNIEVGCQTIPVAKLRELLEAIDDSKRIGQVVPFKDVKLGETVVFETRPEQVKSALKYTRVFTERTDANAPSLLQKNGRPAFCPPDSETLVTIVG